MNDCPVVRISGQTVTGGNGDGRSTTKLGRYVVSSTDEHTRARQEHRKSRKERGKEQEPGMRGGKALMNRRPGRLKAKTSRAGQPQGLGGLWGKQGTYAPRIGIAEDKKRCRGLLSSPSVPSLYQSCQPTVPCRRFPSTFFDSFETQAHLTLPLLGRACSFPSTNTY